jgi:hypothetical protein
MLCEHFVHGIGKKLNKFNGHNFADLQFLGMSKENVEPLELNLEPFPVEFLHSYYILDTFGENDQNIFDFLFELLLVGDISE